MQGVTIDPNYPSDQTDSSEPSDPSDPTDSSDLSDPTGLAGVRRAYDTVAETYAAHFPGTQPEAPLDLAMVDAFAAAVAPATSATSATGRSGARVLDAGCGAGRMSRYLADRGAHVEGVDLSPNMVRMARRDHPDLTFVVAPLTALPYPDHAFDGVLLWYSIIHTPPEGQAAIFAEAARVLRPGGLVLVGFQSGEGTRDVAPAYRRVGHAIELERHLYTADEVGAALDVVGLHETCRLVRRAQAGERDDQAVVLARAGA